MEDNKLRKKGISGIGFRYSIFAILVVAIQMGLSTAIHLFATNLTDRQDSFLSFLLIIISMDVIGFPFVFLLHKKLEKVHIEKTKLGFWKYVSGIFICAGFCGVGSIIGAVLNALLTVPFGGQMNDTTIVTLMMDSNPLIRILTVAILAPIFEELIFRKVLVDHLAKYGKVVAIVASGLMFGMFHGNFAQCFFASFLGFFFAYVYLKTGNILYTIGYHMIINFTTSVFTMFFTTRFLAVYTEENMNALSAGSVDAVAIILPPMLMYIAWMGFLGLCALAGIVLFFINLKKFKVNEAEGALTKGQSIKAVITNPGMIVFFVICVGLFLQSYLPGIVKFFIK